MVIKFSLIVPTRKREDLFLNLCDHVETTTSNLNDIEFIAVIDDDDSSAKNYAKKYSWVKTLIRARSDNLSKDYHTWATFHSKGKYIFILNDDAEIWTHNWDVIAWDKLESRNECGIIYGKTKKYDSHHEYSDFPIISRVAIDVLGHAMSPFFPGWGADLQLYSVFKKIKAIVDLNDIIIAHREIYDECKNLMSNRPMLPISEEECSIILEKDVAKLRNYIGKFKFYI